MDAERRDCAESPAEFEPGDFMVASPPRVLHNVASAHMGGGTLDPLVAHARAQEVFATALANVTLDQLDARTPCEGWTVGDLIEHVIGGNERVALRAGLRTEPPPRPDGIVAAHRATAADAQSVFAAPDAMTRTFNLSIGPIPGAAFLRIRTTDAFVRAWDLARATGQPSELDPELAAYLLRTSPQFLDGDAVRGPGKAFGEAQPCESESPADRLAAFLGRAAG